jgi:DNA-binding XRE family transcriptional regulator
MMQSKGNSSVIYNRLSVFRAERGLSRKDVAEKVGVNPQTIGYLERGDYAPSVELALKLSALFDLPVEHLFSLKPFTPLAQSLRDPET